MYRYPFQYFLISRAELIVRDLARRDPLDIVVFQLLRFALCYCSVEQRQMHRQIRILMDHIHKDITNSQRHRKLFSTLADKGLLFGFPWLNLTANKLPEEATRLVRRALADHEFIALPNEGGYYFYHKSIVFFLYINKRLWSLLNTIGFKSYRLIIKCCFSKNIGMRLSRLLKIQSVFFSTNSGKVLRAFP